MSTAEDVVTRTKSDDSVERLWAELVYLDAHLSSARNALAASGSAPPRAVERCLRSLSTMAQVLGRLELLTEEVVGIPAAVAAAAPATTEVSSHDP